MCASNEFQAAVFARSRRSASCAAPGFFINAASLASAAWSMIEIYNGVHEQECAIRFINCECKGMPDPSLQHHAPLTRRWGLYGTLHARPLRSSPGSQLCFACDQCVHAFLIHKFIWRMYNHLAWNMALPLPWPCFWPVLSPSACLSAPSLAYDGSKSPFPAIQLPRGTLDAAVPWEWNG